MKKILPLIGLLLLLFSCKKDELPPKDNQEKLKDYNKDIIIANWNIEWFGDASGFAGNLDQQEANAGKILKYLDADLYGFCEIVDTARFGRMIRHSLGEDFRYSISFFTNGHQKLAYAYNRHIFRNAALRPFMGVSTQAYKNFSGRYPFLFTADLTVNGVSAQVHFILIHAKANADMDSYQKRLAAARETKDSLDRYYSGKHFMLFGDFNDNFNQSILEGYPSPYQQLLNDPENYVPVTLPLNASGYQSTIHYANSVIDQQIISASFSRWYVGHSARIRTDAINVVPDYKSGTTSDHYPITSVYRISD
ncbi:endonuclease/exonuclease/phosphatase [Niabella insulamsoli]|uniref:endonuclease/exonuclease/phosphatase n=1 Tax=Niabella insulamsoli TaxID=3144874 RepID=UPI0031FCD4E2